MTLLLETLAIIEQFSTLEEDWDGYEALPPHPQIIEQTKTFISSIDTYTLEQITDLFPNPNGTIYIEFEKNDQTRLYLEIGLSSYSFYVRKESCDTLYFDSKEPLADSIKLIQHVQELQDHVKSLSA